MMMEQQTVSKSNDFQERWKTCVATTCYAYKMVERVKETIDDLYEVIRLFINSLVEAFKPIVASFTHVFKDFFSKEEDFYGSDKSYPQSYPQYVDKLKLNIKGFPRPITHCARSRC